MSAHPIATDASTPCRAALDRDDWGPLFSAVSQRLRELASAPGAGDPALARLQTGVLDCVLALEQLQADLQLEKGLRQRLELELLDARRASARATCPRPQTPSMLR